MVPDQISTCMVALVMVTKAAVSMDTVTKLLSLVGFGSGYDPMGS